MLPGKKDCVVTFLFIEKAPSFLEVQMKIFVFLQNDSMLDKAFLNCPWFPKIFLATLVALHCESVSGWIVVSN